jgi:hypothetical protein
VEIVWDVSINVNGFQDIQARATIAKVKEAQLGMNAELFGHQINMGDTLSRKSRSR